MGEYQASSASQSPVCLVTFTTSVAKSPGVIELCFTQQKYHETLFLLVYEVIVVGNGHSDTSSNPGPGNCISHSTNTLGNL